MSGGEKEHFTLGDLISESHLYAVEDSSSKPTEKIRTADDHLREQRLSGPIIESMKIAALENTFAGGGGETPPPKKRGRPPKANNNNNINIIPQQQQQPILKKSKGTPNTTPVRGGEEQQPTRQHKDLHRLEILERQIRSYWELFPQLLHAFSPDVQSSLSYYDEKSLENILAYCKANGSSSSGASDLEFQFVSKAFYALIDNIENVLSLLLPLFFNSVKEMPPFLRNISDLPPGSFGQYLRLCSQAGEGVDTELKEISISFIGYIPKNPYFRLLCKLGYKFYDFAIFRNSPHLMNAAKAMREAEIPVTMRREMQKELNKKKKGSSSSSKK